MGGQFMLPVSAAHRRSTGVVVGEEFDVEVELDTEPRDVSVPTDFAEALAGDAAAQRIFDSLSYSNKLRIVLAVEQARTIETRRRRITSSIESLRAMQR